jgi:DNA-directed DNA polymerase III PolC
MVYAPLNAHSHYSFLEGLPSPQEWANAARAHGLPALALTDRWLTGAVEFYNACRSAGVKPLLGLDVEVLMETSAAHVTLLALNQAGWTSLCALASQLHADDPLARAVPWATLEANAKGLLGIVASEDEAALTQLLALFPQRLYLGLHSVDEVERIQLAQKLDVPLVAAPPMFYLEPEEEDLQLTLTAIRLNVPRETLAASDAVHRAAHFLSPEVFRSRFAAVPHAITATLEIAERCQLELPLGQPYYPQVKLPNGQTAPNVLREKAQAGAERLYGNLAGEVGARLEKELAVIEARGYAPLFLIMQEILDYARQSGVPTASRGSASSSLVAHCLGITTPDPIYHNLYFERFLNPARSTPPDIDTDLCSRRRERVIRFVFDKFGHERVAMVGTINRFRERSALRETGKAFGLTPAEITKLAERLPDRWGPPHLQARETDAFAELAQRFPQYTLMFSHAASLLEHPDHLSVHPGGVVITPDPLTARVPTFQAGKELPVTQMDLDAVEALGLIKIDLLGIRGLTVIGDVAERLPHPQPLSHKDRGALPFSPREKGPGDEGNPLAILDSIADDDAATREIIRAARTIGCFQIESPGMRATLKEINAQSIEDVLVALALYRPGPMTGGLKDAFVRRHLKQEPVRHLHPALAPLLQDTHGVILYQEQVLRIASQLAGMSLADADLLRRAMSHFDPGKQMQTLKEKFMAGAEKNSGVPPAIGARVWELMAAFAGYGFPKAHAASYAVVAWRSAFCKAHYPAEFMAAVLANWGGYYRQRVYLTEARRLGLAVRAPHINHSQHEFCVQYLNAAPHLYMGLDQVRELTQRTMERILAERPFTSLSDFLARVDPRPTEAENLVRVGALEGLGNIPALLRQLHGGRWERGQMALFAELEAAEDDWTMAQKVAAQEELLEASVIAHPLELVAEQIAQTGALNTVAAAGQLGQRVRVAGMRQTWRRISTREDYIYIMALEDLDGMLDIVIAGETYRRHKAAFATAGPYVIEGRVELDVATGEPNIRAEKIEALT